MSEESAAAVCGLVGALNKHFPLLSRIQPDDRRCWAWRFYSNPNWRRPGLYGVKYGAELYSRLLADTDAPDQFVLTQHLADVTLRLRDVNARIEAEGGPLVREALRQLLDAPCYYWGSMAGDPPYILPTPMPLNDTIVQQLKDAAMRMVERPQAGTTSDDDGLVPKSVAMTALGLTRAKMNTYQAKHPQLFRQTAPNRCKVSLAKLASLVAEEKCLAEANAIIRSDDPQGQRQIEKRIAAERAKKGAARKQHEEVAKPRRRSIMEFEPD